VTAPPRPALRDRAADLAWAAAAGLVALVAVGEGEENGRLTGEAAFWALLLGGVGCLMLFRRRRHPVGVAVLLAALATVTDAVGGAVLVAVGTVAANRRWRTTLAVTGLHALAAVPYSVTRPDPDLSVAGENLLTLTLLAAAVAFGRSARSRQELVDSLRERATRAEAEAAARAERLRAAERERIAREMHDALAHRISLVSLHAGVLEIRRDLSPEEVARAAGTIRGAAHRALEDLREILGVLRADDPGTPLRPPPGLADLTDLVAECRAAGTPVDVDDRLPTAAAPPAVARTAYRVVQEGLTNARKHAPGAHVELHLSRTAGGELHVRLRNPIGGAAAPAVPGARSGLIGLAERVGLTGGRLEHGARREPDGRVAFHLAAWLPWPA
jgi:signal transduction histidine kinase